ncbi:MAG: nucleotidyl transferase AbiEii/AbiGii toxin family protein [Desulfobacterales bacterium]|jgi:predicted nucleotidyltransferase component of viral defense system|nr:nucleotidyl transferase AbiEii/AbiGii toxin family protein [Desulfobacterales bacterium]
MRFSRELLTREAQETGFRPEILEKALQLLHLLESFLSHPYLKDRIVLKGGTALNLFYFDIPRLSVDIDLNYVGAIDRETMMQERPHVEEAIQAVCSRENFNVRRQPEEHAGGKWSLRYESGLDQGGNLEVDLNFMFREPLWPAVKMDSRPIGSYQIKAVPVLDINELAAGKLAALLSRQASRDLFDVHRLLNQSELDKEKLRLAFVVYGAMNRKDWRTVSQEDVNFDTRELESQLIPVLTEALTEDINIQDWTETLVKECRQALSALLPLNENEIEFLTKINEQGEIEPDLLTTDSGMQEIIIRHPQLNWKALNVKRHKNR